MSPNLQAIDLDGLLADMPTPLVVLDIATTAVVYANPAAQRYPFAYLQLANWCASDADGNAIVEEKLPYREALRGLTCHRRLVHFKHDDDTRALLFHCHSLRDGLVVLTFDDVTPLADSQRQLRDALQARDELVSLAAHELRSPLGVLQLVAERIARKAADMPPDELRKLADTALRQTNRLNILISNLLDVSRMRSGKLELEVEEGPLGEIVREACDALLPQANAAGTELQLHIKDPALGMWDRVRMQQVVVNLVSNALKYGAGTPITIALERPGADQAMLRVCDGGLGIGPEDRERVFEPYVRASRSHAAHSLGLGLFIVRGIARAHGGDVALDASPGKTVFTVNLPIRCPERCPLT